MRSRPQDLSYGWQATFDHSEPACPPERRGREGGSYGWQANLTKLRQALIQLTPIAVAAIWRPFRPRQRPSNGSTRAGRIPSSNPTSRRCRIAPGWCCSTSTIVICDRDWCSGGWIYSISPREAQEVDQADRAWTLRDTHRRRHCVSVVPRRVGIQLRAAAARVADAVRPVDASRPQAVRALAEHAVARSEPHLRRRHTPPAFRRFTIAAAADRRAACRSSESLGRPRTDDRRAAEVVVASRRSIARRASAGSSDRSFSRRCSILT